MIHDGVVHDGASETQQLHKLMTLYCIVSVQLYSASFRVHQSEALPVRGDTERREQLNMIHMQELDKTKIVAEKSIC